MKYFFIVESITGSIGMHRKLAYCLLLKVIICKLSIITRRQ